MFLQAAPVEQDSGSVLQNQQPDARRLPGFAFPDGSGYGTQSDNSSASADNFRRSGRLTPEERRALRRQIDEVGHDIYAPKR